MNQNGYLPFSKEDFFIFIGSYNEKMGFTAIAVYLLGFIIVVALFLKKKERDRVISCGLGILWLWNGIVFHILNFSALEENAVIFGVAFIFQGVLFISLGGVLGVMKFEIEKSGESFISLFLIVYSLLIYPLIGIAFGHKWPELPLVGLFPCPTVLLTFGFLSLAVRKMPRGIVLIPVLWSIIALGAALNWEVYQDFALPISGMLIAIWIPIRNKRFQKRIKETDEGIQDSVSVEEYDVMQKGFRDRGILEYKNIIKQGIKKGNCLELGPGPGYLGLEWLKQTEESRLIGVEISSEMIRMAERNRNEYGLEPRAEYRQANASKIPLENESVDGAFSNGSLHEWENPEMVLSELHRVIRPEGKLFISDLKRNLSPVITGIMEMAVKGDKMKKGLLTSIQAAYLKKELANLMFASPFREFKVKESPFGLIIIAEK